MSQGYFKIKWANTYKALRTVLCTEKAIYKCSLVVFPNSQSVCDCQLMTYYSWGANGEPV